MWKILSSAAMAALDTTAIRDFGYPSTLLMENAGIKAWIYLDGYLQEKGISGPMVFIAGKGNNGGDALVMARQCLLQGKTDISVILSGEPKSGSDPEIMFKLCVTLGIEVIFWTDRDRCEERIARSRVIIDGIAGTGIKGALRPPLSDMVAAVNNSGAFIAAIDIPSGIGDEYSHEYPAIKADLTLTIGLPKTCLYLSHSISLCGKIVVIPIGFPPKLVHDPAIKGELLEERDIYGLLPTIEKTSYKNKRGHTVVFSGSVGTHGAAVLSANGALRSRGGLVSLVTGSDVYSLIASHTVSVMTKPLDWTGNPGKFDFTPYDAIVFGPGVGLDYTRKKWLRYIIKLEKPIVIDADGITLAAEIVSEGNFSVKNVVFTPHPGEFSRLAGIEKDRVVCNALDEALEFSKKTGSIVVLKGHVTYITSPDGRFRIYPGMNPALGTGGSGDVLSGIIGAFLASGLDLFNAASLGVLVHGTAGKRCFQEKGWFAAEDLPKSVGRILGENNG